MLNVGEIMWKNVGSLPTGYEVNANSRVVYEFTVSGKELFPVCNAIVSSHGSYVKRETNNILSYSSRNMEYCSKYSNKNKRSSSMFKYIQRKYVEYHSSRKETLDKNYICTKHHRIMYVSSLNILYSSHEYN